MTICKSMRSMGVAILSTKTLRWLVKRRELTSSGGTPSTVKWTIVVPAEAAVLAGVLSRLVVLEPPEEVPEHLSRLKVEAASA